MIIVSGRLYVTAGMRETFLAGSREAMAAARRAEGCHDFVVAADPLEDDRVNVYEAWDSDETLEAFRGSGMSDDLSSLIERAQVRRHVIAATGSA